MGHRFVLFCLRHAVGGVVSLGIACSAWAQAPVHQTADAWLAPLPTASRGADATALASWWQRFDDPTLLRLQALARQASPDVASAQTRLMQARSVQVAAGAALRPQVDASASVMRGRPDLTTPLLTSAGVGLNASWLWDLAGGQQAARDAATARQDMAQAAWHEARMSVAVSVASVYTQLRACEAQRMLDEAEARSRDRSAGLVAHAAQVGLDAAAHAWLAQSAAAQARATLVARALQCTQLIQSLSVLTAEPELVLQDVLVAGHGRLPSPGALNVPAVPAQVLAQRPDVYRAERLVQAAASEVMVADAEHQPRVSLTGSLGAGVLRVQGVHLDGPLLSIGPLQASLPLYDGGRREAQSAAARAAWKEATTVYASVLRKAVSEVEEALLRMDAGQRRGRELQHALEGMGLAAKAAEARLVAGMASVLEVEDARRSLLALQAAELAQRKDMVDAWVALYTALGGGWTPDLPAVDGKEFQRP